MLELGQGISPDVRVLERSRDGSVRLLRKLHVGSGIPSGWFVDAGIARMREDLVDASAGHHVAAQEHSHGIHADEDGSVMTMAYSSFQPTKKTAVEITASTSSRNCMNLSTALAFESQVAFST